MGKGKRYDQEGRNFLISPSFLSHFWPKFISKILRLFELKII